MRQEPVWLERAGRSGGGGMGGQGQAQGWKDVLVSVPRDSIP